MVKINYEIDTNDLHRQFIYLVDVKDREKAIKEIENIVHRLQYMAQSAFDSGRDFQYRYKEKPQ